MSPAGPATSAATQCVPRASGDEPDWEQDVGWASKCSLRERG